VNHRHAQACARRQPLVVAQRQFVGQLAGAVGRIVVHHQELERRQGQGEKRLRQRRQIRRFVVGGHDDGQPQLLPVAPELFPAKFVHRIAIPGLDFQTEPRL
jgi:hypothetical protein